MASAGGTDRVTNKQLYDGLTDLREGLETKIDTRLDATEAKFATRSELRMWVALGIVGGQGVSAAITASLTRINPVAMAIHPVVYAYARAKGLI